MNILKWILARPLVAIWVLGAIAILLAMSSGNKKHAVEGGTHDSKNNVVETKKVAKIPASHASNSVNTLPETEVHNSPEALKSSEPLNATEPFTSPEPPKNAATEGTQKNNSAEKVAVAAEDLELLETDELLLMAREAYWNNGLDEAAQIYQQLIKREPQVIEHKGELGNVYWRQGHPKKAAELYSEIAIPLIESGSSDRVSNMVGFIQLFYPDRVEVIMDRLKRSNNN